MQDFPSGSQRDLTTERVSGKGESFPSVCVSSLKDSFLMASAKGMLIVFAPGTEFDSSTDTYDLLGVKVTSSCYGSSLG